MSAFDAVVTFREEEVKRSEGQRQMPGWNFCTFFVLKVGWSLPVASTRLTAPQESLAVLFEGMGLYEDALAQYDELEGLFFQVSKEKNMTWFGTFISPSSKDDSTPLLSLNKKAYRDLILANTITIFDFRIYMLARQCLILGMMGRVLDVCQKSSAFLATFGKRLKEAQVCEDHSLPRIYLMTDGGCIATVLRRIMDLLLRIKRGRAGGELGTTVRPGRRSGCKVQRCEGWFAGNGYPSGANSWGIVDLSNASQ